MAVKRQKLESEFHTKLFGFFRKLSSALSRCDRKIELWLLDMPKWGLPIVVLAEERKDLNDSLVRLQELLQPKISTSDPDVLACAERINTNLAMAQGAIAPGRRIPYLPTKQLNLESDSAAKRDDNVSHQPDDLVEGERTMEKPNLDKIAAAFTCAHNTSGAVGGTYLGLTGNEPKLEFGIKKKNRANKKTDEIMFKLLHRATLLEEENQLLMQDSKLESFDPYTDCYDPKIREILNLAKGVEKRLNDLTRKLVVMSTPLLPPSHTVQDRNHVVAQQRDVEQSWSGFKN